MEADHGGKSNKCNPERNCFVLTLPVFSPFYIYSWKSQGSTICIYKKGTTLLFSNCVPSLIYIYEAKYEPWGGIQIVSPHFVTLKDLFKGNVLYFCGKIVSPAAQTQWEHSYYNLRWDFLSVPFFTLFKTMSGKGIKLLFSSSTKRSLFTIMQTLI